MLAKAASLVRTGIAMTAGRMLAGSQDAFANSRDFDFIAALRAGNSERLSAKDYRRAGEEHGVEPWKLHALGDLEASRGGFDSDGRLVVVPEPHQFSKRTHGYFDKSDPDLSFPKWIHPALIKPGHPYALKNADRWDLIRRQATLNFEAAMMGASWGAFQVMGFNYAMLNFDSVSDLVVALYAGEKAQLEIAIHYLIANDGFEALINSDYLRAASVQNGGGKAEEYAANWETASDKRRKEYA